MAARQLRLRLAPHDADHLCAERLGPLTQQQPDAACCRVHEDGIAAAHSIGAAQQVVRGQALQHQRCGLLVRDAARYLHQPIRRHVADLAIGSRPRVHVGDAIAHLEAAHFAPERRDHTRRLAPEATRQLCRIESNPVIDIDVIEPDGGMAHLHLARLGQRDFEVLDTEDLWPAVLMKSDGFQIYNAASSVSPVRMRMTR